MEDFFYFSGSQKMEKEIIESLKKVQKASRKLVQLKDKDIANILNELADLSLKKEKFILAENQKDLARMDKENPKYDRLLLNSERLKGITDDLRNVANLSSPLRQVLEEKILANGIHLSRVTVPLGVIGIVYESRPNVTFDVFALCLKSGNACVLKGSRDAKDSNLAIVSLIKKVLTKYGLKDVCYLAPAEREALLPILHAVDYIDCAIPRGSQGLINFVRENAKIPVIETGAGICHTYVDAEANTAKAKAIVTNAKARRVSVCNALDCMVIHKDKLGDIVDIMSDLGKSHDVEVFADNIAYAKLEGNYPTQLLHKASKESFGTEFLSHKMSIKTVANVDEALDHVAKYSSKHSEAIVTENKETADYYLQNTDAACVYANVSTAFSDGGQFGLGAEIGISTQKLHARGPMALRELTSYKWIAIGDGHIRE